MQTIGTHKQNLEYLHQALTAVKQKLHANLLHHDTHYSEGERNLPCTDLSEWQQKDVLSTDNLINCITAPEVVNLLTVEMLKKFGISQTSNLPLESLVVGLCSEDTSPLLLCANSDSRKLHQPSCESEIEQHIPCKRKCDEKWKR